MMVGSGDGGSDAGGGKGFEPMPPSADLVHLKAANEEAEMTAAYVRKLREQAVKRKVNAIHAETQAEKAPKAGDSWADIMVERELRARKAMSKAHRRAMKQAQAVSQQLKAILRRHPAIYQHLPLEAWFILSRFQGKISDETENLQIPNASASSSRFLAHKFSCDSYAPISAFAKARPVSVTVLEDRVEASRSLPAREAATLLVAIAIARGFQSVTLSGSLRFQHHAERMLRKAGIEVRHLGATEAATRRRDSSPEEVPSSAPMPV